MLAVLFHRLGPYHHARLEAAGKLGALVAVELSAVDDTYSWEHVPGARCFRRTTLFTDRDADGAPPGEVLRRVAAALAEHRPRAVAIPGWSARGAVAALAWCQATGTPAVVLSDSTVQDAPRKRWKEAIKRRVVRLYASAFVGGTPHAEYLALLGMGRERIFNGYDVVDNDHFGAGADAARQDGTAMRLRLGLPPRYFLASSRFIPKKNLPSLLRAYARYRGMAGPHAWSLVLLGEGALRAELHRLGDALGLTGDLHMPGFKKYGELPAFYGLAGAFVHASTTEQWGLVVNEAMAAGLPVLVSNRCGCAQDLVEHGVNGFLFDPYDVAGLADAMARIAAADFDRAAMGAESRRMIGRWSPEAFAAGLWQAAEVALADAARPANRALDKALLWALLHR